MRYDSARLADFSDASAVKRNSVFDGPFFVLSMLLLAVGVSMDAFAVSVCKGLCMRKATFRAQATCGVWFGGFQALMPLMAGGIILILLGTKILLEHLGVV